jgi:hypothetical protein
MIFMPDDSKKLLPWEENDLFFENDPQPWKHSERSLLMQL